MHHIVVPDDVARLVRAAERMARLAQDIAARGKEQDILSRSIEDDASVREPISHHPEEDLVAASRRAMAAHLQQPDFGAPAIFRNPEWMLMLELFGADRCNDPVSVKAASLTLGTAPSTANRTILELERRGLVSSVDDPRDARRRLLKLTPYADAALCDYLRRQAESRTMPMRLSLKVSQSSEDNSLQDDAGELPPHLDRSASETEIVLR